MGTNITASGSVAVNAAKIGSRTGMTDGRRMAAGGYIIDAGIRLVVEEAGRRLR
jgi:hypothetical protein